MYVKDLSIVPLTLADGKTIEHTYVGWLDRRHKYPKGKVDSGIVMNILTLYLHPHILGCGVHPCYFCFPYILGGRTVYERIGRRWILLGANVIEVPGKDGKLYHAPDLIFHYITSHRYLPPQKFLSAVEDLEVNITPKGGGKLKSAIG